MIVYACIEREAWSSAKVKFHALAHGVCEEIWPGTLLSELKITSNSPTKLQQNGHEHST